MTGARVLFISDSIGPGHAGRALVIARELRRLDPDVGIAWLAGDPARRLIAEASESLLPQTEAFFHETGVAEGFSLNVLRYVLRAQSAWKLPDRETGEPGRDTSPARHQGVLLADQVEGGSGGWCRAVALV
jgi:hypothetical protein